HTTLSPYTTLFRSGHLSHERGRLIPLEMKQMAITLIDEATAAGARQSKACAVGARPTVWLIDAKGHRASLAAMLSPQTTRKTSWPLATARNTRACHLHRSCHVWPTRGFTWPANRVFTGSCASMGRQTGAVAPNRTGRCLSLLPRCLLRSLNPGAVTLRSCPPPFVASFTACT